MEQVNINSVLGRDEEVKKVIEILKDFEKNKDNLTTKKGIYIYGEPGTGKTTFVNNILRELDYDTIKYDAGDINHRLPIERKAEA